MTHALGVCVLGVGKPECSSDDTLEWRNRYCADDRRDREIRVQSNEGRGSERRICMRWSIGIPVRVEVDGKIVNCELDNISASGACARGRLSLSKGDDLILHVSESRSIAATAIRVRPSEIGMEFVIDEREKEQFIEYISHGLPPNQW